MMNRPPLPPRNQNTDNPPPYSIIDQNPQIPLNHHTQQPIHSTQPTQQIEELVNITTTTAVTVANKVASQSALLANVVAKSVAKKTARAIKEAIANRNGTVGHN
ncbi:hypothetical protein HDV02_001293 [Globomyces sp. JEL0801]|nr:hypothetical protein HDV02_001293 [Globomyces sp. JEL0801]